MTLQQKVGQLFMVGTQATAADPTTLDAVKSLNVGNVFLAGRSHGGVDATKAVVSQFTSLVGADTTAGLPLFVATDQEGGEVQVLNGPGFEDMPSGLQQGGMDPTQLKDAALGWGGELMASGVNMNLAPVVDLIPSPQDAANNPPIGGFDRQYGYDPATITTHADAFRAGMDTAGVVPVIKHFPGLGAVTENTDTDSGVTDTTTTATSPSVGVFGTEIQHGARVVMMSTAIYTQLDPGGPAVFSSAIVTGLQQAKAKGIVTISNGLDCDSPIFGDQAAQPLFTTHLIYNSKASTTLDWDKQWGAAQAAYIIDATQGKANVITVPYNVGFGKAIEEGWTETFARCSGCKIVDTVPWQASDQTTNLPTKVATSLAKNPTANAILFPFDSAALIGQGAQYVVNAGLNGKIVSVSGEGTPDAQTLIKEKRGLTAAAAVNSYEWRTYAGIDEINRALNGKPAADEGMGFGAIDLTNIATYAKTQPDIPAAYKKISIG